MGFTEDYKEDPEPRDEDTDLEFRKELFAGLKALGVDPDNVEGDDKFREEYRSYLLLPS